MKTFTLLIAAMILFCNTILSQDFPSNPLNKPGYELVINDEFDGPHIDTTLWIPEYLPGRLWGPTPTNFEFVTDKGSDVLLIKHTGGSFDNIGLQTYNCFNWHQNDNTPVNKIPARPLFSQFYGYVEVRTRQPVASSSRHFAFWMNVAEESGKEIDIHEDGSYGGPNFHTGSQVTGECDPCGGTTGFANTRDDYHIWAYEITPDSIIFYIDNQIVQKRAMNWDLLSEVGRAPFGIMLSSYRSNGSLSDTEHLAYVDYFRAYRKIGGPEIGCNASVSGNGKVLKSNMEINSGNAAYCFNGADGRYDLTIRYFDGSGNDEIVVRVNNAVVQFFEANANDNAWHTYTVHNLKIENGQKINVKMPSVSSNLDWVETTTANGTFGPLPYSPPAAYDIDLRPFRAAPFHRLANEQSGVWGNPATTIGTGYIMYTAQSIHERFVNPAYKGNYDHLAIVKYNSESGKWQWDNGGSLENFNPVASDILLAEFTYGNTDLNLLQGVDGESFGIQRGYKEGDISFARKNYGYSVTSNTNSFRLDGLTMSFTPNDAITTVPDTPVLNNAQAATQAVSLDWTWPNGAFDFTVKYGTASGNYTNTISVGGVSSYQVTGLTAGQTYYFVVSASNNIGESGNSNELNAQVLAANTADYIALYNFDDNTDLGKDATGNHSGSINGVTLESAGKFNSAVTFSESTSSYLYVPDFDYETGDGFTISFWFKIDEINGNSFQYIFNHGQLGSTNSLNIYLSESGQSGPGELRTKIRDINDPDESPMTIDINSIIGDGNWHLYTLTADEAGESIVYIDAEVKVSNFLGTESFDPSWDIFAGGRSDNNSIASLNSDRMYGGGLDDLRIYSRSLSALDVSQLYGGAANPPATPSLTSVEAMDGQVLLTWSSVATATGYKVKYGTATGNYTNSISVGNLNSYAVSSLTNGTPYYFAITAVNNAGESGNSNELSATPQSTSIPAPQLNLATANDGSVVLEWSSVSEAAGYNVYYGTSTGNYPSLLDAGNNTSTTISSLTNDVTYFFVVTAYGGGSESANSNELSATPVASGNNVQNFNALYQFDNNTDFGLEYTGTHNGTVSNITEITGKYNSAIDFSEVTNSFMTIPDWDYGAGSEGFSVAFWFKVDDISGNSFQYIFNHGQFGQANSLNIYLSESGQSEPGEIRTKIRDANDGDLSPVTVGVSSLINDGNWHLYTLVAGNGQSTVYIDGSFAASGSQGNGPINPTWDLFVGGRTDANSTSTMNSERMYGGGIDDLRIYSFALTAAQVDELYTAAGSIARRLNTFVSEDNLTREIDNSNLVLYPNPASDVLNIKWNDSEQLKVEVMSIDGKYISTLANGLVEDNGFTQFDIGYLSNGLYLLKIESRSALVYRRLMVNK